MNAGGVLNTCKSNGDYTQKSFGTEMYKLSGERVSNTWGTCLEQRNNNEKSLLMPYKLTLSHDRVRKDLSVQDGPASD